MYENQTVARHSAESVLSTNKVLRNTYALLSMTLLFSAVTAGISMAMGWGFMSPLLVLGGYFGLLFLTTKFRNSSLGLVFVFALTGFMGLTLGPILNLYLSLPNGGELVMTALGGTGVIFLGLSGYALTTRKDFSFMGGFLMVGILVAFLAEGPATCLFPETATVSALDPTSVTTRLVAADLGADLRRRRRAALPSPVTTQVPPAFSSRATSSNPWALASSSRSPNVE